MSYELELLHELSVSRANFEGQMFGHETGSFAEYLSLTVEVKSFAHNHDPRKVTGEIVFCSHNYRSDVRPYSGSWIFYTADRFGAELELKGHQIERLWNIYSANQGRFLLAITEAPAVPELGRNYEGDFRMNFRTWLPDY